jgi:ABC-type multidrug transport system fused ATPase/permease subunit
MYNITFGVQDPGSVSLAQVRLFQSLQHVVPSYRNSSSDCIGLRFCVANGAHACGVLPEVRGVAQQIEEAARLANAHDFISAFPQGYNTKVLLMHVVLMLVFNGTGGRASLIALLRE